MRANNNKKSTRHHNKCLVELVWWCLWSAKLHLFHIHAQAAHENNLESFRYAPSSESMYREKGRDENVRKRDKTWNIENRTSFKENGYDEFVSLKIDVPLWHRASERASFRYDMVYGNTVYCYHYHTYWMMCVRQAQIRAINFRRTASLINFRRTIAAIPPGSMERRVKHRRGILNVANLIFQFQHRAAEVKGQMKWNGKYILHFWLHFLFRTSLSIHPYPYPQCLCLNCMRFIFAEVTQNDVPEISINVEYSDATNVNGFFFLLMSLVARRMRMRKVFSCYFLFSLLLLSILLCARTCAPFEMILCSLIMMVSEKRRN